MNLFRQIISLYMWAIVIYSLLSWFPQSNSSGAVAQIRRYLGVICEPPLHFVRSLLPQPRSGGIAIDFSPMIVVIVLWLVSSFL